MKYDLVFSYALCLQIFFFIGSNILNFHMFAFNNQLSIYVTLFSDPTDCLILQENIVVFYYNDDKITIFVRNQLVETFLEA